MPNLVKELKNKVQSTRKDLSEQTAVTEVTRLIAEKGAEDLSILREMGMHRTIEQAESIKGRHIELENLEKKYGQIFTIEDIEHVACKYALKFLKSDKYNGPIDPVLVQKIKEFFKDSGIEMNNAKLSFNMYVLAPPKTFELQERPKPQPPDPILFYNIDGVHFRMIHKWGTDLNLWRRIQGIKNSSWFGYFSYWVIKYMILIFMPALLLYKSYLHKLDGNFMAIPIIGLVLSFVLSLIRSVTSDWGGEFKLWKNEYRTLVRAKK